MSGATLAPNGRCVYTLRVKYHQARSIAMKNRALWLLAAIAVLFCVSCAERFSHVALNDFRAVERVVVETSYGPVAGFVDRGVTTFLGMPYAKAPVGELRFAPPQEPERWSHLYPAVAYGPVAHQPPEKTEIASSFFQNEECLSVNVWTPAVDAKRRPVIFFIHGGGFIFGGTADPMYNGEEFARRGDVVFVSANYRVGSFGFLYLDFLGKEFRGTGNNGILDQIAALKWVKANISRFGGDPNNVTIMGESAGSISVTMLMATPAAKGLFHKAIAQSGAPNVMRSRTEAEGYARAFMKIANVQDAAGLRKLSAAQMLEVQKKIMELAGLEMDAVFSPVVDGAVIPRPPYEAIAAGSAAGIPLLSGANKDDFRYWLRFSRAILLVTPSGFLDRTPTFTKRLGADKNKIIDYYKSAYPAQSGGDLSLMMATDMFFWYPHVALSEAQSKNAKTWLYSFAWPSPAEGGIYGAMHAIELPFVFFQLKSDPFAMGPNPPVEFAKQMNDTWINFAKNGVPSAPGLPEWPAYEVEKRATMVLNVKSEVVYDPKRADREQLSKLSILTPPPDSAAK